jgi:hypothetical protein
MKSEIENKIFFKKNLIKMLKFLLLLLRPNWMLITQM